MSESKKQLPSPDLKLALTTGGGLSTFRIPDVKEPFGGREGTRLAREMREKYFRLWHALVLERLAMESCRILSREAQEALDVEINRMLDRYFNAERLETAEAIMKEVTEVCINILIAQVRAILENHARRLGEII